MTEIHCVKCQTLLSKTECSKCGFVDIAELSVEVTDKYGKTSVKKALLDMELIRVAQGKFDLITFEELMLKAPIPSPESFRKFIF